MFKRSGKVFLTTYGIALFALLLNFTLPISFAIAAEGGDAGYLLEICSSSGVKPIQIDDRDFANESVPISDLTKANHNLCSYCSIHHGGVSVEPGLLSLGPTPLSDIVKWQGTSASNTFRPVLNLSHPTRAPPTA